MTTLSGSVDRIVFHNEDSGFCVARFRLTEPANRDQPVTTIVGLIPSIREGEILLLTGAWQTHPMYGRNFRVEQFELERPTTREGIERFLASGVIRGVGPVTATRIVDCFGERAIDVIDQEPHLLEQVAGINSRRLEIIKESWEKQQRIRDLMMFLQRYGISVALASRIHAAYGEDAVRIIERDPYQLAHEIHGIGFRTADAVARQIGISRTSLSRYISGLKYCLSQGADDGHVYLTRPDLLRRASKLLQVEEHALEPALLEILRRGDAVIDGDHVYLSAFYRAEAGAAKMIARLIQTPSTVTLDRRFQPEAAIQNASERQGLLLTEMQVQAAVQALRKKVTILTGGPGTGKTSTLRTLITALEDADLSFRLCAPTGRAAKRVAEATGKSASTIHRLLEYQPVSSDFGYDQTRPLPYDFIIVDEVSMLDILLFYHLLKAIPEESHLVLVGDADQLPAVGPGNVLRDLIKSQNVPTVVLTDLFRQAQGSQIVLAAHAVNRGEAPKIANGPEDDMFFIRCVDETLIVNAIKQLVSERIPRKFGLHPMEDVQVISPMHNGVTGVTALNTALQALLNPPRPGHPELRRGDRVLRVGDKVMQCRNNYDKDVYNGDIGTVLAVQTEDQTLVVGYTTGTQMFEVPYDLQDIDELVLAYTISVHKAQGSEFPCVIMPLVTRHHMLLQRNLLYTAITRARHLCVLVGSDEAMWRAVSTYHGDRRNTGLTERVREPDSALQLELA